MSSPIDRLTAALADRYRIDREVGAGGYFWHQNYDVAPDGKSFVMVRPVATPPHPRTHRLRGSSSDRRFLMIRDLNDDSGQQVVYVENWFQELKAKVAKK